MHNNLLFQLPPEILFSILKVLVEQGKVKSAINFLSSCKKLCSFKEEHFFNLIKKQIRAIIEQCDIVAKTPFYLLKDEKFNNIDIGESFLLNYNGNHYNLLSKDQHWYYLPAVINSNKLTQDQMFQEIKKIKQWLFRELFKKYQIAIPRYSLPKEKLGWLFMVSHCKHLEDVFLELCQGLLDDPSMPEELYQQDLATAREELLNNQLLVADMHQLAKEMMKEQNKPYQLVWLFIHLDLIRDFDWLHHGAISNDITLMQLALQEDIDINLQSKINGDTALMCAVKNNKKESCRFLLDNNADMTIKNHNNLSPMSWCIKYSNINYFIDFFRYNYLYLHDATDPKWENPFEIAIELNNTIAIDFFLKQRSNLLERRNQKEETPLLWAITNKDVEYSTIEYLVKYGANLNAVDQNGNSALHLAACYGDKPLIDIFLKYDVDLDSVNYNGETPLHCAVRNGEEATVETLLRWGANKFCYNNAGFMPIHEAVFTANIFIMQQLIGSDDPLVWETKCGHNILYCAVFEGQIEQIKLLVDRYEVDVNCLNRIGCPPVMCAMLKNDPVIVTYLKSCGAKITDIDAQDGNGDTLLHRFARGGDIKFCESLLDLKPNLTVRNVKNDDPLSIAVQIGRFDLTQLLIARGAPVNKLYDNGNNLLHIAAYYGHLNIMSLLVEKGLALESTNNMSMTPWLFAIAGNQLECAKWLIRQDENTFAQDYERYNALNWSPWKNDCKMMRLLNMLPVQENQKPPYQLPSSQSVKTLSNKFNRLRF